MSQVMLVPGSITERLKQRELEYQNSAGEGYISGLMSLWLQILNGPRRIVELGTYTGNSTFAWLACPNTTVDTVDVNHDNLRPLLEDIERYGWQGRISMAKSDSVEYAKDWIVPLDLVYVDTDHSYDRTVREIEAWVPHIQSGGWLVLDDLAAYPEVAKAFQHCLESSCKDRFDWYMGYLEPPYTPKNHGLMVARVK